MNDDGPSFERTEVRAVNRIVDGFFDSSFGLWLGTWALRLFHSFYAFYLLIADIVGEIASSLARRRDRYQFERTDDPEIVERFRRQVSVLKKIPVHLVLVLGPDQPSYRDIVRMITWSLLAGTSNFSVYDHKNGVDCLKLYESFCSLAKEQLHKIKWGKSFDEEVKRRSTKRINGYSWNPVLTVHVLQKNDGLQRVVDTVKQLHVDQIEKINIPELNHRMRLFPGTPDPDLAIICGSLSTLYGCCPWNMRITQIQVLKSHVDITVTKYLSILHEYSDCIQRYGK